MHAAFWLVFGLGLLMAQYTITGFDASAHMAEETQQASRTAAVGMYMSVVVSVIFGFILLVAVTFAIPSTQGAVDEHRDGRAVDLATSMSQNWSDALLFICIVAQFFCLTASTTSASRMMFAFSRDGAVPGHSYWRRVSRHRVPVHAVFAIGVLSALLMVPAIWNYLVGYAAGTAIAVIGLYIAFVLPVFLRLRLGDQLRARSVEPRQALQVDRLIALRGSPSSLSSSVSRSSRRDCRGQSDFSWSLTNYTLLWFAGIGLFFGGWWVLSANNWFKGPVRMGTEAELEQIERGGTVELGGTPGTV